MSRGTVADANTLRATQAWTQVFQESTFRADTARVLRAWADPGFNGGISAVDNRAAFGLRVEIGNIPESPMASPTSTETFFEYATVSARTGIAVNLPSGIATVWARVLDVGPPNVDNPQIRFQLDPGQAVRRFAQGASLYSGPQTVVVPPILGATGIRVLANSPGSKIMLGALTVNTVTMTQVIFPIDDTVTLETVAPTDAIFWQYELFW